jgi:hypothetical protein
MEKCKICRFYRPYLDARQDNTRGECLRYPPTPEGDVPTVNEENWCGEFKSKPEPKKMHPGNMRNDCPDDYRMKD